MNTDHPIGDPVDLASGYLTGAMNDEQCAAFEAHLAQGCAACETELRGFEPVAAGLFRGIVPVAPPLAVRDALLARMREASPPARELQVWKRWAPDRANQALFTRRSDEGDWEPTSIAGVDIRRLFVDQERDRLTMLVRMAAGTAYPSHHHSGPEECYVLQGDLHVGEQVLHAGDYQRAAFGSHHGVQHTEGGCLLLIVSSLSDEIES